MVEHGYLKGETCNRNNCQGIIDEYESDRSCSCHISPPCSFCVDSRSFCPLCGWDGRDDQIEEDKKQSQKIKPIFDPFKIRTIENLDKSKVDWISKSHTHFSMIKDGVFPPGMSRQQVFEKVKGTFGGRFTMFSESTHRFTFIAYTD